MDTKGPCVIQPYRPSNASEGDSFTSAWCGNCARDKAMSEGKPIEECDDDEKCEIIAMSMAYDIDDPEYPKEWIYAHNGKPMCISFIAVGDPIPPPTDTITGDLFQGIEK